MEKLKVVIRENVNGQTCFPGLIAVFPTVPMKKGKIYTMQVHSGSSEITYDDLMYKFRLPNTSTNLYKEFVQSLRNIYPQYELVIASRVLMQDLQQKAWA